LGPLHAPVAGQGTGLAHGRPSPAAGFTSEGYKRSPVRVTLTGFLSCFLARTAYLHFLLRGYAAAAPVISADCWSWLCRARSCSSPHAWICFCFFFSFFLSIPVWASTRGPVMETTSASLHRSNLLVLHQRRISWLLGLFSFVFLLSCRLGMNPNPSTPVFFHRACAGGRAGPQPSSSLSSPLFRTRSTIWPDLHQIRIPTTAAALAASLSGPTSSPPSPLPYHMIPIGGTRLVAPSSMKDAHR
jgi:hypothetical protein